MVLKTWVKPTPRTEPTGEDTAERDLRQALSDAIAPPVFAWHSSTICEDRRLLVFFDGDDGHTWGFTIDPSRPLAGQPATFRKMD
jgi:hypothetical protein